MAKEAHALTGKIIKAIKKRPLLYDQNHEEFTNRELKGEVFQQIAKELNINVLILKKKWKSLRDCYSKHKRALVAVEVNPHYSKYKKWIWRNELQFLETNENTDQNDTVYCEGQDNDDCDNESEHSDETTIEQKYSVELDPMNVDNKESLIPVIKAVTKVKKTLKRATSTSSNFDKEDQIEKTVDIDYLFKSYAESFKKFHPYRQSKLKLEIANLFAQEELRAIEAKKKKARKSKPSEQSDSSDYEVYQ